MHGQGDAELVYRCESRRGEEHVKGSARLDKLLLEAKFGGHLFAQTEEEGIDEW